MKALDILAGPRALKHLRQNGLRPSDVKVIPAAAGGPKGLILNPLDRWIFGHWLAHSEHVVHLLGASIGAWRMAVACLPCPEHEFALMAEDYITQHYEHEPGRPPTPQHVSQVLGCVLQSRLGRRANEVLSQERFRLHVFASRGRRLLKKDGPLRTPVGLAGAFFSNLASRQAMGHWLQRVVFSDPRDALPFALDDYPSKQVTLAPSNLQASVLASCSIPLWLQAVHDIDGAPGGAYWDGGLTDYHLHLPYADMTSGLVLYPHFQPQVVPGWLDKLLVHRHRASPALDNVVILAPSAQWVASLPGGKLPDRSDFKRYANNLDGRISAWRSAVSASQQLADEFAQAVCNGCSIDARPLI